MVEEAIDNLFKEENIPSEVNEAKKIDPWLNEDYKGKPLKVKSRDILITMLLYQFINYYYRSKP